MSKKKLAEIIGVCTIAIMIIVGITIFPLACQQQPTPPLYGLEFDGENDYVDLDYKVGASLNGVSGITFSAWIKNNDLPPAAGFRWIFGSRITGGTAGFEIGFYDSNKLRIAGRSAVADGYQSKDTTFNTTSQWRHIVGILDFPNDSIKIYLDGVEVLNEAATFSSNTYLYGTPTQEDVLGQNPAKDASTYFNGVISEVRIYNRVLSATEIDDIYRNRDVTDGLIGYWKLNEGSGTIAHDSTANNNTGTLVGALVWFTGGG